MDELKQGLLEFAIAFAEAIGTEETHTMLQKLTVFAKECPDTVVELKALVKENPAMFAKLLTREGVTEAKGLIDIVQNYAPFFDVFQQ